MTRYTSQQGVASPSPDHSLLARSLLALWARPRPLARRSGLELRSLLVARSLALSPHHRPTPCVLGSRGLRPLPLSRSFGGATLYSKFACPRFEPRYRLRPERGDSGSLTLTFCLSVHAPPTIHGVRLSQVLRTPDAQAMISCTSGLPGPRFGPPCPPAASMPGGSAGVEIELTSSTLCVVPV